jgi:hypothetical protein
MYDWDYVAERTEIVYRRILDHPPSSLIRKIHKYVCALCFSCTVSVGNSPSICLSLDSVYSLCLSLCYRVVFFFLSLTVLTHTDTHTYTPTHTHTHTHKYIYIYITPLTDLNQTLSVWELGRQALLLHCGCNVSLLEAIGDCVSPRAHRCCTGVSHACLQPTNHPHTQAEKVTCPCESTQPR